MDFKIYDFETNRYVALKEIIMNEINTEFLILIPSKYGNSEVILMKYSMVDSHDETDSFHKSEGSSFKKERSKERTIAEVIDIVK